MLYGISVPKAAAQDWPAFAKLVEQMRQGKTTWPLELELIQEWYAPHLERFYDDAPLRAADVAQLGQIAAGYGSRERFLTELTLDPPRIRAWLFVRAVEDVLWGLTADPTWAEWNLRLARALSPRT